MIQFGRKFFDRSNPEHVSVDTSPQEFYFLEPLAAGAALPGIGRGPRRIRLSVHDRVEPSRRQGGAFDGHRHHAHRARAHRCRDDRQSLELLSSSAATKPSSRGSPLESHPDQPEWLSHVSAGVLKVKLATALIGISAIHLLKTFINAEHVPEKAIMWQVIIHMTFVFSALAMAYTDKLMTSTVLMTKRH